MRFSGLLYSLVYISRTIKNLRREQKNRGEQCHVKSMMSRKSTPSMCSLDRAERGGKSTREGARTGVEGENG